MRTLWHVSTLRKEQVPNVEILSEIICSVANVVLTELCVITVIKYIGLILIPTLPFNN